MKESHHPAELSCKNWRFYLKQPHVIIALWCLLQVCIFVATKDELCRYIKTYYVDSPFNDFDSIERTIDVSSMIRNGYALDITRSLFIYKHPLPFPKKINDDDIENLLPFKMTAGKTHYFFPCCAAIY